MPVVFFSSSPGGPLNKASAETRKSLDKKNRGRVGLLTPKSVLQIVVPPPGPFNPRPQGGVGPVGLERFQGPQFEKQVVPWLGGGCRFESLSPMGVGGGNVGKKIRSPFRTRGFGGDLRLLVPPHPHSPPPPPPPPSVRPDKTTEGKNGRK